MQYQVMTQILLLHQSRFLSYMLQESQVVQKEIMQLTVQELKGLLLVQNIQKLLLLLTHVKRMNPPSSPEIH